MMRRKTVNWEQVFRFTFECQLWLAIILALMMIVTGGRSPNAIMKNAADAAREQEQRTHNSRVRVATNPRHK